MQMIVTNRVDSVKSAMSTTRGNQPVTLVRFFGTPGKVTLSYEHGQILIMKLFNLLNAVEKTIQVEWSGAFDPEGIEEGYILDMKYLNNEVLREIH